jgi:signal transduction histidine kinase
MLLHDLKSSASMLSLVMQNAADNFDNPEFQRDALSAMSNVVNRIQRLIRRFSAAPREMEFQPNLQLADLNRIANRAIAGSGVGDVAGIKLVQEYGPELKAMLDPENLEKVILNLILNAIEAIDGEGSITVKTGRSSDGYAQISVADTGCGMSQDFIRDRLFQPFQTTKEKGWGIGLYQCAAIVDALHGIIEVQSEQGGGSTFTVKLPIQTDRETAQSGTSATLISGGCEG